MDREEAKRILEVERKAQELLNLFFCNSEYSYSVTVGRKDGRHDFDTLAYLAGEFVVDMDVDRIHTHDISFGHI